jgi:DNA topoisomerase-1
MAKNLVVVESPAKAKTINKMLGGDYIVKASMGHVRDLPVKNIGIDVAHGFKPAYVLVKSRKKIIDELKKTASACDAIYLAPDPDREGEAIAWHLEHVLRQGENKGKPFYRVQYNEITQRAVRAAFDNPGKIDLARVDAQQARRVLDRLVGYMVSPVLWRRIKRGLSAGRVQSVALRLVCEREEEIRNFVPEEYWIIGAKVRKLIEPRDPFKLRIVRINGKKPEVKNAEQAGAIRNDLDGRALVVAEVAIKELAKRPFPPYITSTLQQAGSSYCGFSPHRTMSIAQKLYEGVDLGDGPVGLITYMRTDSFSISSDALQVCRQLITDDFGSEYCPKSPNFYKSRSGAQEAHEAIRPTDVMRRPESIAQYLDAAELKVYRMIWQRFVASQMVPARLELRTVKVDAVPPPGRETTYVLQANASHVVFSGYMKITGVEHEKKEDGAEEAHELVPPVTQGEVLECIEWLQERKETVPSARYSEASLIRVLENNGVGRPSTYAQIVSTLYHRSYVRKDKKSLLPTELGQQVSSFLVANLGLLFDVGFTAAMEKSLDEVEKGAVQWTVMMADFYGKFEGWLSGVKEPAADSELARKVLRTLDGIKEWADVVTKGKRTYGDKPFVDSITKQVENKPISMRQLEALIRIALKYRDQIPDIEGVVKESGCAKILDERPVQPPSEATIRKLELLKSVEMGKSSGKFVDSLRSQVEHGRGLSEAQLRALNKIVVSNAATIPGYQDIKGTIEVEDVVVGEDAESGVMIAAMSNVSQWKDPVKRGLRTFDDKAFSMSLAEHYSRKGYLSIKQKTAIRKMMARYREQIPDYEKVVQQMAPDEKAE